MHALLRHPCPDPPRLVEGSPYLLTFLVVGFIGSCRALSEPDEPMLTTSVPKRSIAEQLGFRPTLLNRSVVLHATSLANIILGDEVEFRFWVEGEERPDEARKWIPVLLVMSPSPSWGVAYVPKGEQMVVIEAEEVSRLHETLTGETGNASVERIVNLLALCLLHEAGHIQHGDSTAAFQPEVGLPYNLQDTPEKQLELEADRFAAEQLRTVWEEQLSTVRGQLGFPVALELISLPSGLHFELIRETIEEGADNLEEMYLDRGCRHPNLTLRFLVMFSILSPDEEQASLIEQFIDRQEQVVGEALHAAVKRGDLERAEWLLTREPGLVHLHDSQGFVPILWAAEKGDERMIELLLAHGGDPGQVSLQGETALHAAAAAGQADALSFLLSRGSDVNQVTDAGAPPLWFAAAAGDVKCVARLLSAGAEIDAKDAMGLTALRVACSQDRQQVVAKLLANGAQVDAADVNGFTPLMEAVKRGSLEITETLLSHGARVDQRDIGEATALHVAAINGRREIAELLLAKGADKGARNVAGETPCDLAKQFSEHDTAMILCAGN